MRRTLGITGMIMVGWIGWWIGSFAGLWGGFILSVVGSGAGLYLGRWLDREIL